MNLETKESGLLDLKALKKDHMWPIKGKPRSPGGKDSLFLPRLASYSHQFILQIGHLSARIPPRKATMSMQMLANSISQYPLSIWSKTKKEEEKQRD